MVLKTPVEIAIELLRRCPNESALIADLIEAIYSTKLDQLGIPKVVELVDKRQKRFQQRDHDTLSDTALKVLKNNW